MKKTYIAPEMSVMELETEALMLTMSAPAPEDGGPSWGGGSQGGMEADANKKRRGTWGNLWDTSY